MMVRSPRTRLKKVLEPVAAQDVVALEEMFVGSEGSTAATDVEQKLWDLLEKKREQQGLSAAARLTRRYKDERFLARLQDSRERIRTLHRWLTHDAQLTQQKKKSPAPASPPTPPASTVAAQEQEKSPPQQPLPFPEIEHASESLQRINVLLSQCDKYLRRSNLEVADICYGQIKPFFDTLSDDERNHVYPHLVSLQNRLIMLQMQSLRKQLTPQKQSPIQLQKPEVPAEAPIVKLASIPSVSRSEVRPEPVITSTTETSHPSILQRVLHFFHLDKILHPSKSHVEPASVSPEPEAAASATPPSVSTEELSPSVSRKRRRKVEEPIVTPVILEGPRPERAEPAPIIPETPKESVVAHFVESIARGLGIHTEEYVKTGIAGLDQLFDKGIPKGSTVVVAGGAGSGKTILGLQILAQHASHGEKCLYMSFEESEERLIHHMEDFGWEPRTYTAEGNLLIRRFNPFDITRSVDALLMEEKGELLIDVQPVILPEGFVPTFVVVDSLTAIASAFSGKETSYRVYIEQLFRFFENLGATAFLISETKQIPTVYSTTGVEEFLADGVIVLYSLRVGNVRENAIEVLKLRGAKHQKKIVAMQVTDQGIVVYPEQEVFGVVEARNE